MIGFYLLVRTIQRYVQRELHPPPDWFVLGYNEDGIQRFLVVNRYIHDDIWKQLVDEALRGEFRR